MRVRVVLTFDVCEINVRKCGAMAVMAAINNNNDGGSDDDNGCDNNNNTRQKLKPKKKTVSNFQK